MTSTAVEHLPLRIKLGHGFGSIAYGVKDNGFSVLLLIFYNQVLGLDPRVVGLILLSALLLDAIVDPLVGHFSDKTYTRWGKRHPWMYGAILPMALSWTMLWYPPALSGGALYAYLLLFAFLMRASVSCYEVPALSVVPALTSDYDERTSITRWRFLFAWSGGLVMLMLAFGVFLTPEAGFPIGQLNINGYHRYGLTGAAFIILATVVSTLTTHRRLAYLPATAPPNLPLRETFVQIGEVLSNRAYLILIGSSVFAFTNIGLSFSITTYMLTYVWELPQSGFLIYAIALFVGIVGAFLLVGAMQNRVEKRTGALVTGIISLAIAVIPYGARLLGLFPDNGSALLMPLLFSLITISNALATCAIMLGQSMMADVVEVSQVSTGRRSEGLFFAGYFFVQKCTTGIGIFITGLLVALSGFPQQARPGAVAIRVLDTLVGDYLIVLVVFGIASSAIIARFPITRANHQARLRQIASGTAQLQK